MYGKEVKNPIQKNHNVKLGKSGFTLVELCVVMGILAILVTMIVSFSVLVSGFAEENKEEYDYLKDYATLKDELNDWVAENDVKDNVFTVDTSGMLIVNGTEKTVNFSDGMLMFEGGTRIELDTIDNVEFSLNGKLIKCVTYRITKNGEVIEYSFVLSLRCGETGETEEVADEN